jgi:hypothetical protein
MPRSARVGEVPETVAGRQEATGTPVASGPLHYRGTGLHMWPSLSRIGGPPYLGFSSTIILSDAVGGCGTSTAQQFLDVPQAFVQRVHAGL